MFNFLKKDTEVPTGLIFNPEHDSDPRNIVWQDEMPLSGVDIPDSGDVEKDRWTLNQLLTTACTCHSTVHTLNQALGKRLSARYAFWKIKKDPKYASSQLPHGAFMVDSLKLMVNEGIASYDMYPNQYNGSDEDYLKFPPNSQVILDAAKHKGGSYSYVTNGGDDLTKFDAIRSFMFTTNRPCKVGVIWRKSFNEARKTGIVPATLPSGSATGHDVMAVAWKKIDGHEYLGFRNSFGDTWGDHGRTWLPKGFFKIQSAMDYLPPVQTQPEPPQKPTVRDIYLEKSKAAELRKMLYEKFPLEVPEPDYSKNMVARKLAGGTQWLILVPAITYWGWNVVDVANWLWANSRSLKKNKAFSLDFTKSKT